MIYLATDHRGYELKEKIKTWLIEWGFEFEDMGAYKYDENDDYPDFMHKAAEAVANDPERSRGIILGGSGQGEAMVANRHKGARAAVFYGPSFMKIGPLKFFYLFGSGNIWQRTLQNILSEVIRLSRQH